MTKRGWRDTGTQRLHKRLSDLELPQSFIETMFETIDLDGGRLKFDSKLSGK